MEKCKQCHEKEENIALEIAKLVIALIVFVIAILKVVPEKLT